MSAMIFVVSLPMSRSSLFVQQSPFVPYWRSCAGEESEKCNERRQLCGIADTDSETDSFQGDRIEVDFVFDGNVHNDVVRTAADCHFRQDAYRRMASVLARIQSAEERERSERARDH